MEGYMSDKKTLSNYVHLGFQATFLYLTLNFLRSMLHEIGHGLAASIVGLDFNGFYSSVFGSSGSFNSGDRSPLQSLITSSGGPLVDLVISLLVFFVVLPRLKRWGTKLTGLMLATATLMAFWGYMMSSGFGSGDFANIAYSLNIPKFIFGVLGLLGLIGSLYLLAYRFLIISSDYFPLNSYGKRFSALFLFFGLPTIIWVVAYVLISPKYAILGQAVFVVGILFLLSILIKSSSKQYRPLPQLSTYIGATAFVIACILWLAVFGPTIKSARGIFWGN
jgi:hypothetical protein